MMMKKLPNGYVEAGRHFKRIFPAKLVNRVEMMSEAASTFPWCWIHISGLGRPIALHGTASEISSFLDRNGARLHCGGG